MTEPQQKRLRRVSLFGIVFMIVGLGMVVLEMTTGFTFRELGMAGRVAVIVSGTALSIWGLKDVIAGLFPRWTRSSDSFLLPIEGIAYLVIMIALFVGSLVGRSNMLLMVFSSLAGPFVMNGWFTFTMLRNLRGSRILPERVMAGETFTTTLILENRKKWLTIWLMRTLDAVTDGKGVMNPEVLFVRVPAGTSRQGHYQLRLRNRGRYQFGPITVTTRFPLGLVRRGTRLNSKNELLVHPRIGALLPEWRRLLQHSVELVSDVKTQAGPFHDELSRIREFRTGDDPRMIHWKTSARTNELMVREYEESRDRDLLLIVDSWSDGDDNGFELGLQFATTVCMEHLRSSRESSLNVRFAGKEIVDWRGDSSDSHIEHLLDTFAVATTSPDIEVSDLLTGIDENTSTQYRVVIVTGRPEAVREALLSASDIVHLDIQVFGTSTEEMSRIFQPTE